MPMTNAQSSPKVRQATLNMVKVRLAHIARQPDRNNPHFLATLSSMRSVLLVIESQAPDENAAVKCTLGIVDRALDMAGFYAKSELKRVVEYLLN